VANVANRGSVVQSLRRPTRAEARRCASIQPTPRPCSPPTRTNSYDISVRHDRCLVHSLVVGQELFATALVADEELAEDEVVAAHFVTTQEPSSTPAYGARLDRNRIQTEVSTKTIMQLCERVLKSAHAPGVSRARGSDPRARAAARTSRGERAPRDRAELYQCLS
jgi:hypothetical protein